MNIEEFVNDYLQEHRHDVLLSPYNGLIDFTNAIKEQMLKEAVEGVFLNTPYPTICLDDCKDYNFKDNQEIRIIIVRGD